MANKPSVLIIGGLDPQGCAGLSADIKTVSTQHCHAVPVVTCLTEQTSSGLTALGALKAEQFMGQYRSAVADIEIAAIKIGLIPSLAIAECIETIIEQHTVPIVLDPVLSATSGGVAPEPEVHDFIIEKLLPLVTLVTPNLPELKQLVGEQGISDSAELAQHLLASGASSCLVKGGHADSDWATDYFVNEEIAFYSYQNKQPHSARGTGCVLASHLAAQLALGQDSRDAVILAKAYVHRGIRLAEQVGPYYALHHSQAALELQDIPKLCYDPELIGQEFQFPPCPDKLGVYPVVDSSDWVAKLLEQGIKTIQLRIKTGSESDKQQQIAEAVAACDDRIAFFVNDYWQMAIEQQAYGVHLGQEDLHDANLVEIQKAGLRLGISTHSYWELARALAINPSYIALGPVFETTSKQMPFEPQGIDRVKQWAAMLEGQYPLVAIGGIDIARAEMLKSTEVGSIAMISAITQAPDYKQATQALINTWQS